MKRRPAFLAVGGILAVAGVVMAAAWLVVPKPVHAAGCAGPYVDFGRNEFCGYFNNNFDNTGLNVVNGGVPNSVNSATDLINWMRSLWNAGPGTQDRTAEEFMVDTMENEFPPGNKRIDADPTDPNSLWNDWVARVRSAEREGRVDWFRNVPFPCGTENSLYQNNQNDDAFYFSFAGDASGCGPGVTKSSIVFFDRNGKRIYTIKRECANPIGNLSGLPSGSFAVTPSDDVTPTYQVTRGDVGTVHVELDNSGPSISGPGTVQVHPVVAPAGTPVGQGGSSVSGGDAIAAGFVSSPSAACPSSQSDLRSGATVYSNSKGFSPNPQIPGLNGPDWFWTTDPLDANVPIRATFNFCVAPAAPLGLVSFNVCFNPHTETGGTRCETVTIEVVSKRIPSVVGLNSDVHAGGAVGLTCPAGTPPGKILGAAGAASYGQYVVSASGPISNFGSDNSAASSLLKLGNGGGYSCIPRDDLLGAALARRLNPGFGTIGLGVGTAANPLDVSTLTAFPVWYSDASDLYIKGQIEQKVTIVATVGTVHIVGDIKIDSSKTTDPRGDTATGVPGPISLGLIASGGIYIQAAVHQVDAYMFSDSGTIDTCEEGQPSFVNNTSNCNGALLVINGFLMGKTVDFRRTGATDTFGNAVTERVEMTPSLFLNPPTFFDNTVETLILQGQGEKQPLF